MTFKAIKGIKCLLTEKKDKPVSSDYEKLSKDLTTCQRVTIIIFACLGMYVVYMTKLYPSGFYIDFLKKSGFNTIIGTVSISAALITSPAGPFIYKCLPKHIRNTSLFKRYMCVSIFNLICSSLMAVVRVQLDRNSGESVIFGTIALLRGIQGFAVGILYVFLQGEVIDLYLKGDKTAMILISSFMQVGAILSTILGTELFVAGGWVLVSIGLASFNILPLLLLPCLTDIQVKENLHQRVESTDEEDSSGSSDQCSSIGPQSITLLSRKVAFYFPDVVLFLNNSVCELIGFVLPARILYSSSLSLSSAVQVLRIFSTVSLISALTLSFIAGRIKRFNVVVTMAVGNLFFHFGAVVAFGATTNDFKFLEFTHQLLIGLTLMGLGEACHLNLYTPSKFSFYEKWNLHNSGLGEQAAKIYNVVANLASCLGTVISALSLSDESEIPTIVAISGLGVSLTLGLFLCNLVK